MGRLFDSIPMDWQAVAIGARGLDRMARNQGYTDQINEVTIAEGGPVVWDLANVDALFLNTMTMTTPNGLLLFIGGIKTAAGGQAVLDGYANWDLGDRRGPGVRNGFFMQQAQEIYDRWNALLGAPWPAITIFGHSAGGAVAFHIAAMLRANRPEQKIQVTTFGSPRPAGASLSAELNAVGCIRVMFERDPVPYVPYGIAEQLGTLNVYGAIRTARFADFRQIGNGTLCASDIFLQVCEVPPLAAEDLRSAFLNLTADNQGSVLLVHSTALYASLATNIAIDTGSTSLGGSWGPEAEPPVDAARSRTSEAQASITRQLREASELDLGRQPVIPPEWKFQRVGSAGVYAVIHNGAVVGLTGSKKQARSLVKQGNEFLAEWLKQPYVDGENLGDSLKLMIQAAMGVPDDFGLERLGDVEDITLDEVA